MAPDQVFGRKAARALQVGRDTNTLASVIANQSEILSLLNDYGTILGDHGEQLVDLKETLQVIKETLEEHGAKLDALLDRPAEAQ